MPTERLEEKRAELIIKYRKLEKTERTDEGARVIYRLTDGKGRKIVMHSILGQKTIGISYIRELKEMVTNEQADKGILVGDGKYTYSARSSAEELGIELIPPTLPTFDIFAHELVPLHEIVPEEELVDVAKRYHAQPFQFPWIKASDPISIILGARPGEVVKITLKSETAGTAISYRYVV